MTGLPARPLADALTAARLNPDRPLVWRGTVPMGWEFELMQDGMVLGEMEFLDTPYEAAGECLGRELEFGAARRFFSTESWSSTAAGEPGPTYRGVLPSFGRLTAEDGESFRWRRGGFGLYHSILEAAEGRTVLVIRPAFLRFLHLETTVRIGAAGRDRVDLAHLLLMTWFLRMQSEPRFGRRRRRRKDRLPPGGR